MKKNYIITAYRVLLRDKKYTSLNVLGLTLGVVVCLMIGIWLQRELSFDNFHPDGDQIYRVSNTFKSESESFSQAPSGPALGAQLPKQLTSITSACRLFREGFKVTVEKEQYVESNCMGADPNFFTFFGFELIAGQPDKVLATADNVVLTERLAIKYFGSVDKAIGKNLLIDGVAPMIVSGVAANPPVNSHIGFDLLLSSEYIKKRGRERYNFELDEMWLGGWPWTYVRISEGEDPKDVESQLNGVVARFSEKEWRENKMSYYYFLQPIESIHLHSHLRYDAYSNGSTARVNTFSAVGLVVLLLACINYINLTTAGAIKRSKETSVRKVLGAAKKQLVTQFFIETLLVTTLSVVLGVSIVKAILPSFSAWIAQPYTFDLTLLNVVIICAFILCVSLISGIYPALSLSSYNPAAALKSNFSMGVKGNLTRKSLVVFQFATGITLLASLIVIVLQMRFIQNKSLGYDGTAIVQVNGNYGSEVNTNYETLRNELLKNPNISHVSKHSGNVVGGLGNGWTTTENLKGEEISTSLYQFEVDPDYMATYDMAIAEGRFFSREFPSDTTKAVIVNETAVKTFGWGNNENAIGKRFGKGEHAKYVVGVLKDFHFESLHKPVEAVLMHYARSAGTISLKVDASDVDNAIEHLKATWKTINPEVPLMYTFVDEDIKSQYGNEQKMQSLFYAFSALSLVIACIGLFGLTIFVVERKIKEISIRKVLGANSAGIVSLISKDFVKLVLIANILAIPTAYYVMNKWLEDFSYRIEIEWWVFVAAGVMGLIIAFATVSFQAIRAALTNPATGLRSE
ncbi:MAG TPA: ABC transporter permease [Chryseolinea sp.]|nr:ABC transporter permease [Chryseolinea sp.]